MKPNSHVNVGKAQENRTMMIFVLAAAMTVAMLIATAFGIHHEAQRVRMDDRNDRFTPYGHR